MSINLNKYHELSAELKGKATLVAVSKTKPAEDIRALYELGHRDFGENYVQELVEKHDKLPPDIRWHYIGHLQSNKVKFIAPFVHLIHGVDSFSLLKEIDKQGVKWNRVIDCLLQVHIAREETKFGLDGNELEKLITANADGSHELKHARICGLMGMASFSDNTDLVRSEFRYLKSLYDRVLDLSIKSNTQHSTLNFQFSILSMGMSADYKIAVEEGSNLVRIGSLLFGERN
jgi:PLP dependent protein